MKQGLNRAKYLRLEKENFFNDKIYRQKFFCSWIFLIPTENMNFYDPGRINESLV